VPTHSAGSARKIFSNSLKRQVYQYSPAAHPGTHNLNDIRTRKKAHRLWTLSVLGFALAVALVAFTPSAQAQSYSVFYTFPVAQDGSEPEGVIMDAAGNLYGAAYYGGAHAGGAVFKLNPAGEETVLYSFGAYKGDGAGPIGVARDAARNIYGTTTTGGSNCSSVYSPHNCGTIFKLDASGHETLLHSFGGRGDGAAPQAGVVTDAAGNLYGTTASGGDYKCDGGYYGCGTIFKLDSKGRYKILYKFEDGADGRGPNGVILDAAGNLYGTTTGGNQVPLGTVFKLTPTGQFSTLFTFTGGTSGFTPFGSLALDAAGNLYGTTLLGGTGCSQGECTGTVFKLDPQGNETVLHNFTGGADGSLPYAGVTLDSAGNIYGTTANGGDLTCSLGTNSNPGCGVVFKLDPSGQETVLQTFSIFKDGEGPVFGVTLDATGDIYGPTGGGAYCNCGTIFKIALNASDR
jgi:uncharacterized repeat protein (TIGR03803 family)